MFYEDTGWENEYICIFCFTNNEQIETVLLIVIALYEKYTQHKVYLVTRPSSDRELATPNHNDPQEPRHCHRALRHLRPRHGGDNSGRTGSKA